MTNLSSSEFIFINAESMTSIFKGFRDAKIKFWDYVSSHKAIMIKAPYQIAELNKGYFILNDKAGEMVLNDLDGLINNTVAVTVTQEQSSPILFSTPQTDKKPSLFAAKVETAEKVTDSGVVTAIEYKRLKGLKRLNADQKNSITIYDFMNR